MKTHAFLFFVSLLCFHNLHGSALKITGQVEAMYSFRSQSKQIPFQVIVTENKYLITMDDRSFGPKLESTTALYDGSASSLINTYQVSDTAGKGSITTRENGSLEIENRHAVNIRPSAIPSWSIADAVGSIWLTVAAGHHLSNGWNVVESPATVRNGLPKMPDDFGRQPAEVLLLTNEIGFPFCRSVKYYTNILGGTKDNGLAINGNHFERIESQYSVIAYFTNNGVLYPKSTKYVVFDSRNKEKEIHKYLVTIDGVERLHSVESITFAPDLDAITLFTDERFNDENGLHFNYVTNRWLSKDEVMATHAYKGQKDVVDALDQRTGHRGMLLVVFATVLALGFLLFWKLNRKRRI